MAKPVAAEMIVADFDDQLRLQRTPFGGAVRRPAARTAGRIAGKTWILDQGFELCRQCRLLLLLERGRKANMVQQPFVVIEPKQQGADHFPAIQFVRGVAEAADHAIGAAEFLDLLHAVAVARLIGQVEPLGDNAI